jgi:hypothetical protein
LRDNRLYAIDVLRLIKFQDELLLSSLSTVVVFMIEEGMGRGWWGEGAS